MGVVLEAVTRSLLLLEGGFCSSTQELRKTTSRLHRCVQMAPLLLHLLLAHLLLSLLLLYLLLRQVGNVCQPTWSPATSKCIHALLYQSAATASKQRVRHRPRFNALRSGWDKWRSCAKNAQCILGP